MPRIRTIDYVDDDALRLVIDNADAFEVVYDRYGEQAIIEIRNQAWDEPARYLAVIATEPSTYITDLIDKLETLRLQLRKPREFQDR